MQVERILTLSPKVEIAEETRATEKVVGSFAEALKGLLLEVERTDAEAVDLKRRLLIGEPLELHEVLIAVEKAHLAFQTLIAFRNKLLEAYQELTRMPL